MTNDLRSLSGGRFPGVRIPRLADAESPQLLVPEAITGLDEIQRAVEALVLGLRSSDEAALERQLTSELNGARERLVAVEAERSEAEVAHRRAQQLASASAEASVDITESRFRSLRPLIRDVYGRLDPHPSFKVLDLQHDFYRARGATRPIVVDAEEDVEADPMLIFSSSQANIVALSYFLALGWASSDQALPILLLDDPVQSMDDVNVLGFADLCRFARRQKQVIISTHERRFASLLERKLASRDAGQRTRLMHFVAWDRRGPIVETEDVTPQVEAGTRRVMTSA